MHITRPAWRKVGRDLRAGRKKTLLLLLCGLCQRHVPVPQLGVNYTKLIVREEKGRAERRIVPSSSFMRLPAFPLAATLRFPHPLARDGWADDFRCIGQ